MRQFCRNMLKNYAALQRSQALHGPPLAEPLADAKEMPISLRAKIF